MLALSNPAWIDQIEVGPEQLRELAVDQARKSINWFPASRPLRPLTVPDAIQITIDPTAQTIAGEVVVRATVLDSGLSQLVLDLADNLTVSAVQVFDSAATFTHVNRLLSIDLPPLTPGTMIESRITYSGTPDPNGFGSFVFSSRNGNDHIWSLSEPYGARDWWPCKDDPSDKPDSVNIVVTVPSGLVVASNGVLDRTAQGNDGTTTYFWKERYPIATYLVSVAIYPYSVWTDTYVGLDTTQSMTLQFFSYPDHLDQLENNYLRTKDMLHEFALRYGEYPFMEEKYGHAEFGWGGGMEHQTITSLGGWGLDLLSHELAHQWWGDMITCADFHHIWLNEGFATYSQAIWWESQEGMTGYHNFMNSRRYYGGGTIYVENPTSVNVIFNYDLSYAKAAWVLHMLRHVVGDSTFFQILQTYATSQYRYGSATTEQFRDICETVSGRDLHPFFDQWIYGTYYPQYTLGYSQVGDSLHVEITQSSPGGTLFSMPVDLEIHTANGPFTTTVDVSHNVDQYRLPLTPGTQVTAVFLDPDQWILRTVNYIPMGNDGNNLPTAWEVGPAYPNPFNGAVVVPYSVRTTTELDISILDITGREWVTTTRRLRPGSYQFRWNGKTGDGRELPGGVYLIRIRGNQLQKAEKVVFLK
ncbi:MAG: T9SS C-terminal target domain-containing protein [Candidatus Neomarinimicrobiota bacterium]|nr:MAG: T9SS C-terminal target domain-containing protein [Candidatus Neomarinimicrobiota bacterium]